MDTCMDRGDTRHLLLGAPVVHLEVKEDVGLEAEVVQVDSHDAKIGEEESERCHEVVEVVHFQKVAHERGGQTVVVPMVLQCGA